jgi:hypothetical protein
MKAIPWAGLLLAVGMVIVGCSARPSPTQAPSPLGLDAAPWANGSTASYEWVDSSGTQIGASQFEFSLRGDTWVITDTDKIGEIDQTSVMTISATTLAPLGEYKTIQAPNTDVQLTTTYEGGKLDIKAIVNGQTRTATMSVPSNAIDNDQFLMTLRALPFAEGYKTTYVVIVAQNALKVNTTVTVQAQEQIEVPAGSFETWPVELNSGQTQQFAWYQVDAPHLLIQYNNGTNRMLLTQE